MCYVDVGVGDLGFVDRDQGHVVEAQADASLRFVEGEALATADVGPELPTADVDPDLGRRTLEDDPVDRALDDVVEAVIAVVKNRTSSGRM